MFALATRIVLPAMMVLTGLSAFADEPANPFPGVKSAYHGFDRYDFEVDGQKCLVVTPKMAAKGTPWIWRAEFFDHRPEIDLLDIQRCIGGRAPVALLAFFLEALEWHGVLLKQTGLPAGIGFLGRGNQRGSYGGG